MPNGEASDGALALRLITDHLADCSSARLETKAAIKDVRDLLIRFISAIFGALVIFAGYTYAQGQRLEQDRQTAVQTELAAIARSTDVTAAKTVQKLGATP